MIKKIESISELRELSKVFALAFESKYQLADQYLETMLKNTTCVILGAISDQQIVGGLVAFEMTPMHGTKEFFVYDIAVHPEFRKIGLGRQLMEELRREARKREVGIIFVEAESDDGRAVAFYRAIGGEEVGVCHFNFKV